MGQLETRTTAKARLQSEGRWKEALAYRESLKAQDVPPAEAYRRMVEAFPPLSNGPAAAPSRNGAAAPEPPPARRRKRLLRHQGPVNLYLDILWVYVHLPENTDIRRPPSPGALSLLEWARRHTDQFFKLYLAKFITEEGWSDFVYQLNNWLDNDEFVPAEGIWDFVRPLEDHEKEAAEPRAPA
jgi:hypothetical protein